MKNIIKVLVIGLMLTGVLMFTGCSSTVDELEAVLTPVENRFDVVINKMDGDLDNMDSVALRENVSEFEQMIEDLTIARAEYEQGSDEYKLFSEFITAIKYTKEIAVMAADFADNPLGAIFEAAVIEEKVNTYTAKYSEALDNYIMYKEKLGLKPYVTDNNAENMMSNELEEVKAEEKKEEPKQEAKVEESKKEEPEQQAKVEEQQYCEWCESANAGHTTDEHVAQCYDCGELKNVKEMEYNGRSFHCGCVPEKELLVCPSCGGSFDENDMLEETENGIMYCYNCYDDIMNAIMGGDANGDLEEWEY